MSVHASAALSFGHEPRCLLQSWAGPIAALGPERKYSPAVQPIYRDSMQSYIGHGSASRDRSALQSKRNAIPVSGHVGLQGCDMLKIPHCLDNRITDGGKVSPTHRLRSTPQKLYFYATGTHFCYRLSKPQGPVRPEGLGKLKKFSQLIGSRNRDLPAYSTVS
jgi:hypothetical protein